MKALDQAFDFIFVGMAFIMIAAILLIDFIK